MSEENAVPEWVAPGKTVLIATRQNWGAVNYSLDKAKVAKLTATQVVLDNGDRYRRRNLIRIEPRETGRGRFYVPTTELKDPASDEMKAELELHRTRILKDNAVMAMDAVRKDPTRAEITETIRALEAWRERLPHE